MKFSNFERGNLNDLFTLLLCIPPLVGKWQAEHTITTHDHNALWLEEVKPHSIGYNVRGHNYNGRHNCNATSDPLVLLKASYFPADEEKLVPKHLWCRPLRKLEDKGHKLWREKLIRFSKFETKVNLLPLLILVDSTLPFYRIYSRGNVFHGVQFNTWEMVISPQPPN